MFFLGNFVKNLSRRNQIINYKMSAERVMSNNKIAEQMIDSIKNELSAIKNEKIQRKMQELEKENIELRKQVELARKQLIQLETLNGKKIISIPGSQTNDNQICLNEISQNKIEIQKPKSAKDSKPKKEKNAKPDGEDKSVTPEIVDVGRLDFRVGRIIEVSKHPDADSLYLEKIDCGDANPRTVVSGLVKFIPIEQMQNRLVIVLCNLKPAKMRGITSEAMVMCASSPEKVEILSPPSDSKPGDLVFCEGFLRNPDAQLNPKKKIFETIAPDLKTNDDFVACYKGGALFVEGKGIIKAESLKNVEVK